LANSASPFHPLPSSPSPLPEVGDQSGDHSTPPVLVRSGCTLRYVKWPRGSGATVMHGSFIVKWFECALTCQQRITVFRLTSLLFPNSFRFVDVWVLLFFAFSIAAYVSSFFIHGSFFNCLVLILVIIRLWESVPYGLKVAIFTKADKGTTDILDPRRSVIILLFNYAEMIFWFAACYAILQAKGQLELAKGPKAIILLRESVMSMVANSSDAFGNKSTLAWFVILVQNVLGLIMTIVIATRFISFMPQPKAKQP
jgi:hypothetical protein